MFDATRGSREYAALKKKPVAPWHEYPTCTGNGSGARYFFAVACDAVLLRISQAERLFGRRRFGALGISALPASARCTRRSPHTWSTQMMQCPCAGSRDATMRLNAHLDSSAAPRHQMLARTRLQKIWDVLCLLQPTGTARRCISDLRGSP